MKYREKSAYLPIPYMTGSDSPLSPSIQNLTKLSIYTMSIPTNLTKEFVDFVKSIGESKTKQEEDLRVVREIGSLKNTIMDNKSTDVRQAG